MLLFLKAGTLRPFKILTGCKCDDEFSYSTRKVIVPGPLPDCVLRFFKNILHATNEVRGGHRNVSNNNEACNPFLKTPDPAGVSFRL